MDLKRAPTEDDVARITERIAVIVYPDAESTTTAVSRLMEEDVTVVLGVDVPAQIFIREKDEPVRTVLEANFTTLNHVVVLPTLTNENGMWCHVLVCAPLPCFF